MILLFPSAAFPKRSHVHHRPGCRSVQCDHRVDVAWGKHHHYVRPGTTFDSEGSTPFATEASWYYDEGTTGCGWHAGGYAVAHKTLACGTRVRICNQSSGACEVATVDDRGPYVGGRELDLNVAAKDAIGCDTCMVRWGVVR